MFDLRGFFFVLATAFALFAFTSAPAVAGGMVDGSISGRVLNGTSPDGSGTCVTAYGVTHATESQTTTDSNGDYTLTGLGTGQYKVLFERCNVFNDVVPEYYPDKATFEEGEWVYVTTGQNTPGIDGQLSLGGKITGKYSIDAPVAPVFCYGSVSLLDSNGAELRKKNLGAGIGAHDFYEFAKLKTGDYLVKFEIWCGGELDPTLSFSSTDYYRSAKTLEDATPVHVTEGATRSGINYIADGGASISGTVTDEAGTPLGGICIDSYDDAGNLGDFGRTAADGTYTIDQFSEGAYRLRFSDCLDQNTDLVPEFYDDKSTLGEAAPITLERFQDVTGIDAQLERLVPPPIVKAKIGRVTVKGPARVKRGKKATYRVSITNSGEANAFGVKLTVKGRGVDTGASVGTIGPGKTRVVKVNFRPKKAGKTKLTFRISSRDAGGKTVKRNLTVRK